MDAGASGSIAGGLPRETASPGAPPDDRVHVVFLPVVSSCRSVDRVSSRWYRRATGLLGLAMLAVVLGTGLAHAIGEGASPPPGGPLAAPSLAPDLAIWTTPLSRVSLSRLSDAQQRLGQLLGLAQPHLDGVTVDSAEGAAVVAVAILLRLVAERDHGVRAPPGLGRAGATVNRACQRHAPTRYLTPAVGPWLGRASGTALLGA